MARSYPRVGREFRMSIEDIENGWERGIRVSKSNPDIWRKDLCGAWILVEPGSAGTSMERSLNMGGTSTPLIIGPHIG